jgi:hypothetical protein
MSTLRTMLPRSVSGISSASACRVHCFTRCDDDYGVCSSVSAVFIPTFASIGDDVMYGCGDKVPQSLYVHFQLPQNSLRLQGKWRTVMLVYLMTQLEVQRVSAHTYTFYSNAKPIL